MNDTCRFHRIEKGMKCQDVKVAVFTKYMSDILKGMTNNNELGIVETYEPYPKIYNDQTIYTETVYAPYPYAETSTSKSFQKHAERVVEILRYGATEAKIYVFELDSDYAMKWCADNGIHAINTSWSNDGITDETTKYAYDKGLLMFTSAGNRGRKDNPDLTYLAKDPNFYAIGSMHIDFKCVLPDGSYDLDRYYELTVPDYASEGEELDYCAIGRMRLSDGLYHQGSSFASPLFMLMTMQYIQRHFDAFGYFPDRSKTERFFDRNITDVEDEGFDIYTGKGILRLPEDWKQDFKNDASNYWELYALKTYGAIGIGRERRLRMPADYWIKEAKKLEERMNA